MARVGLDFRFLALFAALGGLSGCVSVDSAGGAVASEETFFVGRWGSYYSEPLEVSLAAYIGDERMRSASFRMEPGEESGFGFGQSIECGDAERVKFVLATIEGVELDTKSVYGCGGMETAVYATHEGVLLVGKYR